jgi:7,8-dihydropterin-6-yl-methyl-4-(beta-D-ribofuranosyl)aminobenzene 5'-phosphate synthase
VIAARRFTGMDVALVEGGFHLLPYPPEYVAALATRLKNGLGVRRVAPNHCTGQKAMAIFRQVYGENYVHAGIESGVKF